MPLPTSFTPSSADLLGEGGEAQIYALNNAHIVRLFREGATATGVKQRTTFLAEIAQGAEHLPFETPLVIEQDIAFGRICTVEKRIAGTSLLQALADAQGEMRRNLIEQYMETAWQVGEIEVKRPFFGEISRDDAVQTTTWQAYLTERAQRSLNMSPLNHLDATKLAEPLGEPAEAPAFVHLDYFPGNVMVDGDRINAVIDFGYSSIIGDRRMNTMVAAAHLVTPRITPTVTTEDREVAFQWLHERDLFNYYEQGVRWLAAYWTFATDDVGLYEWCCSILC